MDINALLNITPEERAEHSVRELADTIRDNLDDPDVEGFSLYMPINTAKLLALVLDVGIKETLDVPGFRSPHTH